MYVMVTVPNVCRLLEELQEIILTEEAQQAEVKKIGVTNVVYVTADTEADTKPKAPR